MKELEPAIKEAVSRIVGMCFHSSYTSENIRARSEKALLELFNKSTSSLQSDLSAAQKRIEELRRLCGEAEHIISVRYGGVLDQYAHTHDDWEKDIIKQLQTVKGDQP